MKICNCCKLKKPKEEFLLWQRRCVACKDVKYCKYCDKVKSITDFRLPAKCKKCDNKTRDLRRRKNPSPRRLELIKIRLEKQKLQRALNRKPRLHTQEESNALKRLRKSVHRIFRKWTLDKNKKSYDYLFFTKEEFLKVFPVIPNNMDIDHKIPMSWFKIDTPIGIIFSLENLQLLERKENQKKSNYNCSPISVEYKNTIISWLKEQYKSMILTNP